MIIDKNPFPFVEYYSESKKFEFRGITKETVENGLYEIPIKLIDAYGTTAIETLKVRIKYKEPPF